MELMCKSFADSAVEVKDAEKGIVEAVVGRVGVKDLEGDIFLPGSFGERNVRVSAYNHRSWPSRGGYPPVGRGRIYEEGDQVRAEIRFFLGTSDGRDHFTQVKEMGDLQEWSFGWLPGSERLAQVSDEQQADGVRRAFASVPVAEVSPVLIGASIGTRTTSVKYDESGAVVKESDEDRREFLGSALQEELGGDGRRIWIVATFTDESRLAYEVRTEDGDAAGLFRVAYEVGDDDEVTFGEPEEVRRITTFEPVASDPDATRDLIETEVAKAKKLLERAANE